MIKIYDTKRREVCQVHLRSSKAHIYCCGPTVYRDAHIGNFRTFLLSDVVRRILALDRIDAIVVQNITDVGHLSEDFQGEDKILSQARSENTDPFAIARKYEDAFHKDLARLNIQKASLNPRASESIGLIIDSIALLLEKGFAYIGSDKSVYFDAKSFDGYGAISGNRLDALKPGHRYEYKDEGGKRFHADWALWKSAGERTEMVWPSPWGVGFPGWHIECSAMSIKYLDGYVDIHLGGIDLRFPHHENERAQSNSLAGEEVVGHWIHGEHLLFEGRKMSKSAGNVILVEDLISQGLDPLALRLALLENRYRSQMDLTWDSLKAADSTIKRWRKAMVEWGSEKEALFDQELYDCFTHDVDTPRAIQRIRVIEKDREILPTTKRGYFLYAEQILALDLLRPPSIGELSQEDHELLRRREEARKERNWKLSDQLRDELLQRGIVIADSADGQSWTWR